jgi:preprotein translocase subunit SecA
MLQIVDTQWKDHLYSLDHLKEGIGLRGYGQKDPLVEYKKESFALFQDMKGRIDDDTVRYLFWLKPVEGEDEPVRRPVARRAAPVTLNSPSSTSGGGFFGSAQEAKAPTTGAPKPARTGGDDAPVSTVRRDEPKVGRNDPCPCGSGKKFKKCHGAQA